jgi:hypothetical protein
VNRNPPNNHDEQAGKDSFMKNVTRAFVIGALLGATSLPATGQGLVWESVTRGGPVGDSADASVTYMMPGRMKHDTRDGDVIIVRIDQQKLYSLNAKEKTYWVMTFAELEQMMKAASARMEAMKGQMQEQLKNLPPEQRAMVEKMYGAQLGGAKGAVSVKATGKSKTILGYSTKEYLTMQGDTKLLSMYVTPGIKEFEAMRKDWEQFNKRIAAMSPGFVEGMMEAYTKIDGFPLEMEVMGATTTVTKLEKKATPASEFEVPAGYTLKKPPMMEQGKAVTE